jgi:pimeloyl-ACP methyl ester carboxylesterase
MPEIQLRGGPLDGLPIHYLVDGRGPAVVLVHGLGGFAESWRHNVAYLARHATVYALDLPGFGFSGKPRAAYRLPFFAAAIRGFARLMGLDRVSLIGHSLGGAIAVAYAAAYPADVERVALVGAVVPGFAYRTTWIYRLIALPGVGELISLLAPPTAYRAALARCFAEPVAGEIDFLLEWGYGARTSPEGRAAYLATLRGVRADFLEDAEQYRRALRALAVPVLAIHGRQDPIVPPEHCTEVIESCRRGAVRWLDRCGHFPQIEHAPAVNAWLADFLVGRTAPR